MIESNRYFCRNSINYHTHIRRNSLLSTIFTVAIVLSPILNIYYSIPPVGWGDLLLVTVTLCVMVDTIITRKGYKFNIYILFLAYSFLVSLLVSLSLDSLPIYEYISKYARIILYALIFICYSRDYFNIRFGARFIRNLSVFVSLILIIQALYHRLFKVGTFLIIPNTNLNYSIMNYVEYLQSYYFLAYRPSSIFLEVAHFAQYTAIGLVLALFPFDQKEKPHFKAAVIITIAILFSLSSNGLVIATIVWAIYLYKSSLYRLNPLKLLLIFTFLLAAGWFITQKTNVLDMFLYRLSTIGVQDSTTGSLRLLRGLDYFRQFDLVNQIFGIGFGNYVDYVTDHSLFSIYNGNIETTNEYMNALSYVLVSCGLVGFVIYLLYWFICFKVANTSQKVMLVVFFMLLSTSSIFLMPIYMVFAVFISHRDATIPFLKKKEHEQQVLNI